MLTRSFFFIKKTLEDILQPNRFSISKNYKVDKFSNFSQFPYALDFTTKGMLKYYGMKFDEAGIVMTPHYVGNASSESHYYSFLKIAHYLLAAYNDYLKTPKDKYFYTIKKHANYLIDHSEKFNNVNHTLVWPTKTSVLRYNVPASHISSITQGLIISAMIRAFLLLKDETYLDIALKAIKVLSIPIEDGGVLANSKWGKCYEEYPRIPYVHVINGFIFCLIGLHDLFFATGSKESKSLYIQGIETLKRMIPEWILPHWSKYDLCDITDRKRINLSTRHYQYLHLDQMLILHEQTKDKLFYEASIKLNKQLRNPLNNLRVYLNKLIGIVFYY